MTMKRRRGAVGESLPEAVAEKLRKRLLEDEYTFAEETALSAMALYRAAAGLPCYKRTVLAIEEALE